MVNTIDMQHMRYINLFEKITRISTRFCFKYNETIFFCVPKALMSKAIGKEAINIRKISRILNKKIKVVAAPNGIDDLKIFIQSLVDPLVFKDVEVIGDEVILTASSQSKAALIGRFKRRLLEMQGIVSNFFGKEFRIV